MNKTPKRMYCINCKSIISENRQKRHAKFCCPGCEKDYTRKKYRELNPENRKIGTGTIGAMNELKVAAHLMSLGLHVFRNMSPNGPCDLAVLNLTKLIRVEVTGGSYSAKGTLCYPKHNIENYDLLAVVTKKEITYIPDIKKLIEKQGKEIMEDYPPFSELKV